MKRQNKAALAPVVLFGRERVVAVVICDNGLVLRSLRTRQCQDQRQRAGRRKGAGDRLAVAPPRYDASTTSWKRISLSRAYKVSRFSKRVCACLKDSVAIHARKCAMSRQILRRM